MEQNKSGNSGGGMGNLVLLLGVILLALVAFAPDELHVLSDWLMELRILSPSATANPNIFVNVEAPDMSWLGDKIGEQTEIMRQQVAASLQQVDVSRLQYEEVKRGNDCVVEVQDTNFLSRFLRTAAGDPICD